MSHESEGPTKDASHWSNMATNWHLNGPPLKPGPMDAAAYWDAAKSWIDHSSKTPRILLLGVTPELYALPWPAKREFLAVERNPDMIKHVWPGPEDEVRHADWQNLQLPAQSRDLVLCDGGLMMFNPSDRNALIADLYNTLSPGGLVIIRSFVLMADSESPDAVIEALLAGEIPNLHILKLRLGMAIQQSSNRGAVLLNDIWKRLRLVEDDWSTLADRIGWTVEHLRYIDCYRNPNSLYHFYPETEIAEQFCNQNRFQVKSVIYSDYALGERCPIATFQKI